MEFLCKAYSAEVLSNCWEEMSSFLELKSEDREATA